MPYSTITYDVSRHVATVTLDRPQARNGFTATMADELVSALGDAERDPEVRAVVLTGAGPDFCVGADLSGGGFGSADDPPDEDELEPACRVAKPLYELSKPVIAAVRGAAVGVGSTMLLPADFRLAATDTRFGFVFARRGIFPEAGSAWFLPRIVGLARAQDWLLTGRLVPAQEALEAGLVRSLHEPEAVLDAAHALAAEIVEHCAPVSLAVIRRTLLELSGEPDPYAQFALDTRLIRGIGASADTAEGVASFFERRAPRFPGRVPADLPGHLPWLSR